EPVREATRDRSPGRRTFLGLVSLGRAAVGSLLLGGVARHLFEHRPDFLGLTSVERMRFQQVEHEQPGLTLVELVDQVVDPLLPDFLGRDRWPINECELAAVARYHALGFEAVEEGGDGGVRPLAPGCAEGFEDLADRGLASIPEDL